MKIGNCKKCFILVLTLFCLTGCSVDYKTVMQEDGTIIETVTILEKADTALVINSNLENFVENYYSVYAYNTTLNYYMKELVLNEDEVGYVFVRTYKNMESYINESYFLNLAYNKISYEKSDNGDDILVESNIFTASKYFSQTINGVYGGLNEITASIEFPFYMKEYTAMKKDDEVYSFVFDKNSEDNEFKFYYDSSRLSTTKFVLKGEYIVIGFYILSIIVLIGVVMYFNVKNNKI